MNAVSLRLLGCETGVSPSGLRTLRLLADILGLPVVGSRKSLSRTHYTATGFNPLFGPVLVVSAPIRVRLPTVPPGSSRAQTPTDSRSWILSTQTPQPLRFRGRSIATP